MDGFGNMNITFNFVLQSTFMNEPNEGLQAIRDIRQIMERSSRFISLSGWSGVVAGICALVGSIVANQRLNLYNQSEHAIGEACKRCLVEDLILIAVTVFITAIVLTFLLTWLRNRKTTVPLWGNTTRRLMWNTLMPMAVGGFMVLRLLQLEYYQLVSPACLIFYGLALVNGSKFTIGEVKYLGYFILFIGIINLWMPMQGLYFWALGFGVFHIFYGLMMWWKYERKEGEA
jgi:hypothetical protein